MGSERMDSIEKLSKLREEYVASLQQSLSDLKRELEGLRTGSSTKKIPVVEEPARVPEKCYRDYLLGEIVWLQNDMMSERKLKQGLARKLGKEVLKHKYIVDRREGVDLVGQNLRKVSSTLAGEVEKFWKGVRQLAEHRIGKSKERMKREENQKKLDELVDRTEKFVKRKRCGSEEEEMVVVDDKKRELDKISMEMKAAQPTGNSFSTSNVSIPVPSLLRANLREYQHIGMEWLATLHARGLNGILADEMGLGKTLQTIALLAHLACEKGIWGPHLIVVPTSVMINWEIEFKKFLPGFKVMVYFGNPKERRVKRVGWSNNNIFNVCICSYALVLQDALVFRKKNWHYLILDEAHQIKNFKSLRWQNLLTFKTDRRLLLTGTPLQNNLIELWSLLHFLMPAIFTSHLEFQEWFSDPLTKAIESSSAESVDSNLVSRLHALIRPFLLRRLKKDVETQMPSKFEHVIPVPLSLRQKVLYDEFISFREKPNKEKKSDSSYIGLMNVLMQLRKVCNHPDLLEPRAVKSPFVMGIHDLKSTYFPKCCDLQLRLHPYLRTNQSSSPLNVSSIWEQSVVHSECVVAKYSHLLPLKKEDNEYFPQPPYLKKVWDQKNDFLHDPSPYLDNEYIRTTWSLHRRPQIFPELSLPSHARSSPTLGSDCIRFILKEFKSSSAPFLFMHDYDDAETTNRWTVCVDKVLVPSATQPPVSHISLLSKECGDLSNFFSNQQQPSQIFPSSEFYCQFPDKRFLEWDCGKFKTLKSLLTRLHKENHKVILFTQMSKMLDIIEAFANLCGFTYVRLDGATKVTDRQLIVDRFNRDKKLFLFISSTRAGGVGINLTGADTVVFFDSDWNPAMDRQAMDRCHRIGQVRDVNVYRLISQNTIEENIFAKQIQKRKLDEIVIDGVTRTTPDHDEQSSSLIKNLLFEENKHQIYGTHVLHERPEDGDSGGGVAAPKILAQIEDPDDIIVPQDTGKAEEEPADPAYLKLPEIVRHAVGWLEHSALQDADEPDSDEWQDLENAQWESDDEHISGSDHDQS